MVENDGEQRVKKKLSDMKNWIKGGASVKETDDEIESAAIHIWTVLWKPAVYGVTNLEMSPVIQWRISALRGL